MSTVALNKNKRIPPQKFALWVGMASMIMFFGAFTSAYIVKQSAGNWLEFPMPRIFYISTAVLILSSVVLHLSYRSYIAQQESKYKIFLVLAGVLGIVFITLQYLGWQELFGMGIDLKANVSGSFFYLISGMHVLHVLGGLSAIAIAIIHAYTLPFTYKEKRKNRFELVVQYWHFVDVLWIYLFFFLLTSK